MSKFGLKLLYIQSEKIGTPFGRVGAEVGEAIEKAASLRLRSLDLLHISHLLSQRKRGYPIENFVTSDREFLKVQNLLSQFGVGIDILV
jgi:hypothetical protein